MTSGAGSSPFSAETQLTWPTDAKQLLHPPPLEESWCAGWGGVRVEWWDQGEKNLFGCEHNPPFTQPAAARLATGEDEGPTGVMSGPYLTSVFFSWLERGVRRATTSWGRRGGKLSQSQEGTLQDRLEGRNTIQRNSAGTGRSSFQTVGGRRAKGGRAGWVPVLAQEVEASFLYFPETKAVSRITGTVSEFTGSAAVIQTLHNIFRAQQKYFKKMNRSWSQVTGWGGCRGRFSVCVKTAVEWSTIEKLVKKGFFRQKY